MRAAAAQYTRLKPNWCTRDVFGLGHPRESIITNVGCVNLDHPYAFTGIVRPPTTGLRVDVVSDVC